MMRGIALRGVCALRELEAKYGGRLDPGARSRRVARLVGAADASDAAEADEDLLIVTDRRYLPMKSGAKGSILCVPGVSSRLPDGRRWIHDHAPWVMASILETVEELPSAVRALGACVSEMATVHPSATVCDGAVVLAGARIGPDAMIGHNAVIYGRVCLGARVHIGPCSVIGRSGFGWVRGPDGRITRMPQLGGVVIEDDAEVGALCTVDAGTLGPTRLGSGVRLDAHVHVGHNAHIEPDTLVAAQVGFAGSVHVGARTRIGGQAGIADHVRVGRGVSIAAKSGVIRDVIDGAVVAGFPAITKARWLRAMATLLRRTEHP